MTAEGGGCQGESERKNRALGLFLIGLGLVLLLRSLGLLAPDVLKWVLPIALAGFGLSKLLRAGHRPAGVWLFVLGVLLTLHQARAASLRETWPVLVVTAGLAIVVGAFDPRRDSTTQATK